MLLFGRLCQVAGRLSRRDDGKGMLSVCVSIKYHSFSTFPNIRQVRVDGMFLLVYYYEE
jgi:hypothetical protein